MVLALRAGDDFRILVTAGKPRVELVSLRIVQRGPAFVLTAGSSRASERFGSESALWAGVASLASAWASEPGWLAVVGPFDLSMVLVVLGMAGRVLDSQRYETEVELWSGLADHAAGLHADLALARISLE